MVRGGVGEAPADSHTFCSHEAGPPALGLAPPPPWIQEPQWHPPVGCAGRWWAPASAAFTCRVRLAQPRNANSECDSGPLEPLKGRKPKEPEKESGPASPAPQRAVPSSRSGMWPRRRVPARKTATPDAKLGPVQQCSPAEPSLPASPTSRATPPRKRRPGVCFLGVLIKTTG